MDGFRTGFVTFLRPEVTAVVGHSVTGFSHIVAGSIGHHLVKGGIGSRHDDLTADTLQLIDDQLEEVSGLRHRQVGNHDGISHNKRLQLCIALVVYLTAAQTLHELTKGGTALQIGLSL